MLLKTNYDEKFHLKYIKFLGMKILLINLKKLFRKLK